LNLGWLVARNWDWSNSALFDGLISLVLFRGGGQDRQFCRLQFDTGDEFAARGLGLFKGAAFAELKTALLLSFAVALARSHLAGAVQVGTEDLDAGLLEALVGVGRRAFARLLAGTTAGTLLGAAAVLGR